MMTFKNKVFYGALAAIAVTGMTACSNSLDGYKPGGVTPGSASLVRSTEVIAWSGTETLGGSKSGLTRGADVNGNLWYQNWDRPVNVTQEEIAKVLAEASKKREGETNSIHIDWNNYWVQQVYTGEATYTDGNGKNIGTGSSHMNHLLAYSSKKTEYSHWDQELSQNVYNIVDKGEWEDKYEHVNNFNNGSNNTVYTDDITKEQFIGTTLMTDMYADGITDQFGYHNTTDSKNHFEYIILEIDGSYYVCFDFYATHPEGQEANKNMDVERDWVFNDWIVKISPAYHVGETPKDPDNGNGGNTGGDNDGDDNENPGTPSNPNLPVVQHRHANEVEVNLSINDIHTGKYGVEDLVSKLSIHVRYGNDIEVRIPVPTKYAIQADDLTIVEAHHLVLEQYGRDHTSSYNINGNPVTLTVNYENAGTFNTDSGTETAMYIVVKTSGINQEVIDYLMEKNGDGINFEVWNYYGLQDTDLNGFLGVSLQPTQELIDDFQEKWLNKSLITFKDGNTPRYYINAFNDTDENQQGKKDCTVTPTNVWLMMAKNMPHLNSSQYNIIYYYTYTPDPWHDGSEYEYPEE